MQTVGVVESHSLVCKAVDIGGLEMPLSIAAKHTASEVVAVDENDIRVISHSHDTKRFKKSSLFI